MQIFTDRSYAALDFASCEATLVRPSDVLLRRQLDLDGLSEQEQDHIKQHLFDELLRLEQPAVEPRNAILDEQREFVAAVRSAGPVRVSGEQARAALDAAERVLDKIAAHRWTADVEGPMGPLAIPAPALLRGPHWPGSPRHAQAEQRKAG
jgi:hypothetical protein